MSFSGWNKYQLGDLVDVKGGKRLPKGKTLQQEKTNHPYIRITDLNGRKIDKNNLLYVTDEIFQSISRYIVNKGDIILSIVGTIGLVAKIDDELDNASLTENCVKFIEPKIIERDFLFYYLTTTDCQNEIRSKTIGTTQPKLPIYNIKSLEINLPDLKTQQRIASILSSLDDAIELNQQINKTLEEMAKAIFKEWFVDFNFPNATGKFQETEIGKIPVGWKVGKLNEALEIKYGKDHKHLEAGEIPVYGSGGIMRYANKALYESESILIPRKGTLSNLFYINNPFWTVDTMFYSKVKIKSSGKYLFHLLQSLNLASMNVGSAVPSLTTEVLNNIQIAIPDDSILKQFETVVTSMFNQIEQNIKENQYLINLRDTLLPKLMKGEIEINSKADVAKV